MVKDALKLPRKALKPSRQSVITIEGESKAKPCHVINGLVVTPLDGQPGITLPPAVMQNAIPDAIAQVPSRRDVAHTRGYEEFARHFPNTNANWPTLLLIGRDCMPAQWQEQYYSDENTAQMVSKTPLGWTLVGFPENQTPVHIISSRTKGKNWRRNQRRNRRRYEYQARSSATNLMTSNSI